MLEVSITEKWQNGTWSTC